MRAVFSVIVAAGRLKKETPDEIEDKVLLRALRDVNVPKFLAADLVLFENIILDLFPGVSKPEVDYGKLTGAIDETIVEMGLMKVPYFIHKVI